MNTLNPEVISDPEDKQKLFDIIITCANSMTRIAAENDLIKESIKRVSKELGIPKPIISKMVKVYFKQNFDAEVAVNEEFEALYQEVVK